MPDKQSDLAIIIDAVNNASKQLKQVEKDLSGLGKAVEDQDQTAQQASIGFGQLVAGMATGTIVANLAMGAFRKLASAMVDIPRMAINIARGASEIEGLGIAMHVVANNAGITAEEVDKVRDSVVDQNVTTEAANRLLTDLIRNQLDYAQATDLASAAQNIAVASGVSSSETIERISQSISSGNTWLLRQLGLTEHLDQIYGRYADTLGKTRDELTEFERKQAVVNYVLQEGEKYAGAYDQAMKNAAKVMRSTKDRVKEISYTVGKLFEPALYEVTKAVYNFVNSIVKWAKEHEGKLRAISKQIGNFMRGVVGAIKAFIKSIPWDYVIKAINFVVQQIRAFHAALKILANTQQIFIRLMTQQIRHIKSFGEALWALIRGDFKGLKQVYIDWRDYSKKTGEAIMGDLGDIGNAFSNYYSKGEFDLKEWWNTMGETDAKGWEDRLREQEEALDKMSAQQQKENKNYTRAVEKRVKNFEESFEGLVLTHRDTIRDLTEDLKEENKDYQENVKDMLEDYNEAMEEIEDRHEEKSLSIMEDMEDERKKAEEEIEKITEKYNEERTLIEREGEARLQNLKAQLAKEVTLGDNANKEKIEALNQMIAYEESGLSNALDDKKAKYDEEVSDVNESLNEKLDKLQKELDEENRLFKESLAKRKADYEEDLAAAKESYEEKRQSLQEELDKEMAIRERYADDFERLANAVAEDDLTRLIRKHNEELAEMERDHKEKLAEMERDHKEKLADIKENAFEQGSAYAESFASGMEAGYPAIKSSVNQINNDLASLAKKYEDFENKVSWAPGFAPWETGAYSSQAGGGGGGSAWQHGGLATQPGIVGEAGPELVLPLNFPKRMAQIMQAMGMGAGKREVVQNFYVTVEGKQDIDVLMERAGFALQQGGGFS